MNPVLFFKSLSDSTRLQCLLLIQQETELCVCELTCALADTQPKVSRHLAQLKSSGLLIDRRQGQWVYYSLNPSLPKWCTETLLNTTLANRDFIASSQTNLENMGDRPTRILSCCT